MKPKDLCESFDPADRECLECPVVQGALKGAIVSADTAGSRCRSPLAQQTCAEKVQDALDQRTCERGDDGEELGNLDDVVDGGFEGLARAVRRLADAAQQIESSGLNRRAVAVLLADASGLGVTGVLKVLNALRDLEKRYLSGE